ncbi:hypothetical protein POJ06DRAFT_251759 [Lipomyces tetrasporus]|uniref:Uncharacterized protein n=1 Tax=Lipomyces tetrasporus TaxID=54092 RepID=A0AAD7VU84_9ASCO|nr:uncharacterized protein POJ06DRAFT_251759 [Lipomyces tetrasporus]KAJ8101529.1 hypothetical protein POJ06DRAFT_251759 [Lipomyces tetrasporus]
MSSKEYDRRPNPPGWRPPRAPYNPYDPEDFRPPEGYPSEYNRPIAKDWRVKAGENQNYRQFVNLMRMQAFPGSAPRSEMYPGRLKVLRKIRGSGEAFANGIQYASFVLCGSIIVYGTFIYRWNDGYDNIFSGPYRLQLRIKKYLFGRLSEREEMDLHPRARIRLARVIDPSQGAPDLPDTQWALERPRRVHTLEAERAIQELEEHSLRSRDALGSTPDAGVADGGEWTGTSSGNNSSRQWFQFWKR